MRNLVHVPQKSNRKSILKKKEIITYFPVRKDIGKVGIYLDVN